MKYKFKTLCTLAMLYLFTIDARPINVVITSKSSQKVAAIKASFNQNFIHDDIFYFIYPTNSGIPEQPVGRDAAMQGIHNRLENLPKNIEADYIIAIENYIEQSTTTDRWYDKGLIAIQQKTKTFIVTTKPVFIPDVYIKIAQQISDITCQLGYTTTVGKAIQQSFIDRNIDPTNWHQEPEFGGVSRQELLEDALHKALHAEELEFLKNLVLVFPDFPKPGITFANFLPLFQSPEGLQTTINLLAQRYNNKNIDVIVGLESRGFIIGAALAYKLGVSFVAIRKPGKLPGPIYSVDYQKEYGFDTLVIAQNALQQGQRVLIIDDLIATGGSARAAIELVNLAGGTPVEFVSLLKVAELEEQAILSIPTFNLID